MIPLILLSIALIGGMCMLAYTLAIYCVPFMFGFTAARFAYASGAGIVGLLAGGASFGVLASVFATLRSPRMRLALALFFAAPAAFAGYTIVHGVAREAVPSIIWRQIFCIAAGTFVGMSALAKLADPPMLRDDG